MKAKQLLLIGHILNNANVASNWQTLFCRGILKCKRTDHLKSFLSVQFRQKNEMHIMAAMCLRIVNNNWKED